MCIGRFSTGGSCLLRQVTATHPRAPTSKMDPKWCIAPCYIWTLKWRQSLQNIITLNGLQMGDFHIVFKFALHTLLTKG